MSDCHHLTWLQPSGSPEASIHDEDQLQRIVHGPSDPTKQKSSLVLFIGPREKEYSLRDLFPLNNLTRFAKRHSGTVNIRIDTTTLQSDFPVLFADSDPFYPSSNALTPSPYHETSSHLLAWKVTSHKNLYAMVHAQLLCYFADVVCFFCNDRGQRYRTASVLGLSSKVPKLRGTSPAQNGQATAELLPSAA